MLVHFEKVKSYLHDMEIAITSENVEEELVVINDENKGIHNMVIDCEEPILILEQVILPVTEENTSLYKRLLQMNRALVHGAFTLDDDGSRVIFRDTLELENLDRNELEGSIKALELALVEFGSELLQFATAR